jgi:beta-galactosidase
VSFPNTSSAPPPALWLGAACHPEDWPEERWPDDVQLMGEAGFNVVRLADCAWTNLEPVAGSYNFGWLDRAIARLGEARISTVLTIPTGLPPAWLAHGNPWQREEPHLAQAAQPGGCSIWCVNSPGYQEAARHLVGAMAEHFGPNPHVIGWEITAKEDPVCYCPHCQALFRAFLAEKYVLLGEPNLQPSPDSGSRGVSDWMQITLPACRHDPGLDLDFRRFLTKNQLQLQGLQISLLRPHMRPGVWITQAFAGWSRDFEQYVLAENLDVGSSESLAGTGQRDYRKTGALHDLARGLKRRNFWIMATTRGSMGKAKTLHAPFKDETQAMAWQAVAHGADGLLCWEWRSAPNSAEPGRHNTLLDQSGQPRPLFEEIRLLGLEFNALSPWLAGSTTAKARVAILNSAESRWTTEGLRDEASFDYVTHLEHWYRPLAVRNVAVDIVPPEANLDQYKMVIAPALSVLNDKIVSRLQELVRHSGHLVLTLRTGIRDEHNALLPLRQPGPLTTIAGVEVEDFYPLDEPVPVKGNWFEGVSRQWAERLRIVEPNKAVKIARYGACNGWLDNEVAITVCSIGTGLTYMVGAYLDVAAQQAMVDHFLQNAGLQKIDTPPGVEVCIRIRPSGELLYVVINHERAPATVTLPSPAENPLTGQPVTGSFRLAPYGVAVLVKTQTLPPSSTA